MKALLVPKSSEKPAEALVEVPESGGAVSAPDYGSQIRRVKAVLALILCLSFGLSMLLRADFVRRRRLLVQAWLTGDPEEQIELYHESLYYGTSLSAEKGLVRAYAEAGRWGDAGSLAERLLLEHPEDAWLSAFKEEHTPAPPQVSMPGGTYDDNVSLQFSLEDDGGPAYYGAEIVCELDGMPVEGSALMFTENGDYRLTLRTCNGFGFSSPQTEYTYVIDKLIPLPPEADTASGYFLEAVQVSLSQPEGFPVHYTLDGSEPDSDSPICEGPIAIEAGRTLLRAAACSPKGVLGEEREYYYHVRPWSSGSWRRGLITAHGDYYFQDGQLKRYINGEEADGGISLSQTPSWVCEYNDGFLIAAGARIYTCGLEDRELVLLAEAPDSVSVIYPAEGDGFVLISGGRLYLLRDGQFEDLSSAVRCMCATPDPALFYLGGSDGLYTLKLPERAIEQIAQTGGAVKSMALGGGSLFFDSNGSIYRYNLSTAQLSDIQKAESETYQEDPYLLTNGFEQVTTVSYDSVYYANGRLYYREEITYEWAEIPWSVPTRRINQSTDTTEVWAAYNFKTGKQEPIDAPKLQLGNGYCRLPDSGSVLAQK
ncbi:chitobiase/beta-hexosaminidase C-terminal domain-containing protein [uncultured Oscillibacter sp.]|uniref:chitobiase/beta-hexosaminidase C-terminal domain-containing protein n=1 Tax=uncultured Oscillibacter sp. TaxID=876091 RepID=UPI0026370223|nr:chitobiase/beta-hexosaminidase C-terminal domain-containing protein [uncultured Oscillibacter sp.]